MMQRPPRRTGSTLLLLTLFVTSTSGIAPAVEPPNVLFIAIDDLNDWVGPLGGHPQVQTPNLDRLAARGTVFTNAHCQAPLCNASRTSLMTGLRPGTTGVYALQPWFRTVDELADHVTLPQHFRANGYHTYTTGKIYHGGYPPQAQRKAEFDEWGPGASVGAKPPSKLIPPTPEGNHPLMDWGTWPHDDEDRGDFAVASWAVEQLESPPEEPFFLACGFFLPHVPCYAPPKWFELYPEETLVMPPVRKNDRDDVPDFAWYLHWKLPEPRLSWLEREHQWKPLVRAYLASISFVDGQVGRVLDALDESGRADNTIVVLWSDHGWHLGEKGISGKNTVWERSARVPLIFAGPGVASTARCGRPAELLDIYPTLSELCGLPALRGLDGHSLVPQLKDCATEREWPAVTTHNPGNHGIRSERWRYIHYADGSEELYDMDSDPVESRNLAGEGGYDEVLAAHRRWLPEHDAPPVRGSHSRLLDERDGRWFWENEPINPTDLVK